MFINNMFSNFLFLFDLVILEVIRMLKKCVHPALMKSELRDACPRVLYCEYNFCVHI